MTKAISQLHLSLDSFHLIIDEFVTDYEDENPRRNEVAGWIQHVTKDGYQAMWHTVGVTPEQFVGDIYPTQEQAMPTLAGVLLGILASAEMYEGSILEHLEITARSV